MLLGVEYSHWAFVFYDMARLLSVWQGGVLISKGTQYLVTQKS